MHPLSPVSTLARTLALAFPRCHIATMEAIRTVCVYCGSGPGTNPAFEMAAREFGRILAKNHVGLVFGGGSIGMMGALSSAVLAHCGRVPGIIPAVLNGRE